MVGRYRSFLPLDVVDNVNAFADADSNPAELYALSEEREEVNKSIEALPEKARVSKKGRSSVITMKICLSLHLKPTDSSLKIMIFSQKQVLFQNFFSIRM